jgi:hypothetical protein
MKANTVFEKKRKRQPWLTTINNILHYWVARFINKKGRGSCKANYGKQLSLTRPFMEPSIQLSFCSTMWRRPDLQRNCRPKKLSERKKKNKVAQYIKETCCVRRRDKGRFISWTTALELDAVYYTPYIAD